MKPACYSAGVLQANIANYMSPLLCIRERSVEDQRPCHAIMSWSKAVLKMIHHLLCFGCLTVRPCIDKCIRKNITITALKNYLKLKGKLNKKKPRGKSL